MVKKRKVKKRAKRKTTARAKAKPKPVSMPPEEAQQGHEDLVYNEERVVANAKAAETPEPASASP